MASTMAGALKECLTQLGGIHAKHEIENWIEKHYPRKWKPGTLTGHFYGGRVNHPLAYQHHPGQKKFLFDHGEDRYELYDLDRHGIYRQGIFIGHSDDSAIGWILIHSESRYAGEVPDNPIDELGEDWPGEGGVLLWHWNASKPYNESSAHRRLLLAWHGEVFGEATATITHKLGKNPPSHSNFAFRLESYERLRQPIPLSELKLGNRESQHRSLIRLDSVVWEAYQVQKKKLNAEQPKIEIEACLNPQKGRQGYGLTAKERQCVELHAMEVAKAYLVKEGYGWTDVSGSRPFDYLATKGAESLSVEVKGTTGLGDKILLTANEVKHQRAEHPRNMLIVVHSIRLEKGDALKASGGFPQVTFPWLIKENNLEPTAYAYTV